MAGFRQPVMQLIKERKSVRTYSGEALPEEARTRLMDFADGLAGPFAKNVRFVMLDRSEKEPEGEKLGTYGVIRGARNFIAAVTEKDDRLALAELGYRMEQLVLFATSLGLGTCWLGGSFYKSGFARAAAVAETESLPIVSPVGPAAAHKSLLDKFMRASSGGDNRRQWQGLFFENGFGTPLTKAKAGGFAEALAMLRLAPSAMNAQPWRVVKTGGRFDFYVADAEQELHYVDLGIAMSHFALTLSEEGVKGGWRIDPQRLDQPGLSAKAKKLRYLISWLSE